MGMPSVTSNSCDATEDTHAHRNAQLATFPRKPAARRRRHEQNQQETEISDAQNHPCSVLKFRSLDTPGGKKGWEIPGEIYGRLGRFMGDSVTTPRIAPFPREAKRIA